MKRSYLFKRIAAASLAICLFAVTTVGVSLAYYTDTSNANGSVPFATVPNTEITEDFDGLNKDIKIKNTGDVPVVVRFRADYPSQEFADAFATISMGSTSSNWVVLNDDDGWVYYAQPLMKDAQTDVLDINVKASDDAPGSFDIVALQQYAVAYYEAGVLTAQFGDSVISFAEGSFASVGAAN